MPALLLTGLLTAASLDAATTNVFFGGASLTFRPPVVSIREGDTVVFQNQGGTHTVTGTGADPICGSMSVPTSCSHLFPTAGSYAYRCNPHVSQSMTGLVIVTRPPANPATLSRPVKLPNGHFQFSVSSTANRTNVIQASTNLSSSNWTSIASIVPTNSTFTVTDSNAPQFRLRFYRVAQP